MKKWFAYPLHAPAKGWASNFVFVFVFDFFFIFKDQHLYHPGVQMFA